MQCSTLSLYSKVKVSTLLKVSMLTMQATVISSVQAVAGHMYLLSANQFFVLLAA